MVLYRLTRCYYADDLTGEGARIFGGRWNREGKPALYLASSLALGLLEVLVHLPPTMVPEDYCVIEIEVPDNNIIKVAAEDLPVDWKDISPPAALKQIGDKFLKSMAHLMMRTPSSIVSMEYNYLLNPLHPDAKNVKIVSKTPFSFDKRLINH